MDQIVSLPQPAQTRTRRVASHSHISPIRGAPASSWSNGRPPDRNRFSKQPARSGACHRRPELARRAEAAGADELTCLSPHRSCQSSPASRSPGRPSLPMVASECSQSPRCSHPLSPWFGAESWTLSQEGTIICFLSSGDSQSDHRVSPIIRPGTAVQGGVSWMSDGYVNSRIVH